MARKKIKIRFIEHIGPDNCIFYSAQIKGILRWRDAGEEIMPGPSASAFVLFTSKNTSLLIDKILREKYSTTKEFVDILEYPMLKEY